MSLQEAQYDYRKFAILYVDDEAQSLKAFSRAFGDDFRIFTAINAADGVKLKEAWLSWLRATWPTATCAPARVTLNSTVPVGELGKPSWGELT